MKIRSFGNKRSVSALLTDFVIYTQYRTNKKSEAMNPATRALSFRFEIVSQSYKEFDALIPHHFVSTPLYGCVLGCHDGMHRMTLQITRFVLTWILTCVD
jgi:hypothetical protein